MVSVSTVVLVGFAAVVQATPALTTEQAMTAFKTEQIDSFSPYTYYASAAYCAPAQTLAWNCGTDCEANPDFKTVASGGDGASVQYWYVGYDTRLKTVIVVHQGTNFQKIDAIVTDARAFMVNLDSALFPGIDPDIACHDGFANEHALTAVEILAAVKKAMTEFGATSVTMVGHSLGAAIALLDSVYLPFWLPVGTTFRTVGYGLPRVGNQAFADYVDAHLHLTHVNNREDPIPNLPLMILGYVHPAGEVHIEDSGEWVVCPGQDNPSTQCIAGEILNVDVNDHYGPYNGIWIVC